MSEHTRNTDIVLPFQRTPSLAADFEKFDEQNPQVYSTLVRLARELVAEGHTKIGLDLIYNVARWVLRTPTTAAEQGMTYRLNNCWSPFYARKIMAENADLAEVFDLRKAPDADAWAAWRYDDTTAA